MIHLGAALFIAVMGFLTKEKRLSWLIAGYNTSSKEVKAQYDEGALCDGVGRFMYALAGTLLPSALGEWLEVRWLIGLGWGAFVLLTVGFLIYANTGGRYMK